MPIATRDILHEPFQGYEKIMGPIDERVHPAVAAVIKCTLVIDCTRRVSIAEARSFLKTEDYSDDDDNDSDARTSEWLAHHMGASESASARDCE
jgi:hypothetical protein